MQQDIERLAHPARILEIGGGRAVAIVLVLPVRHEEPLNLVAELLEKQRRYRGVDTAREANDDGFGVGIGEGGFHAPIIPVRPSLERTAGPVRSLQGAGAAPRMLR